MPADLRDTARKWLTSTAFRTLVLALGGPPVRQFPQDLPGLINWTSATLDMRQGRERQHADTAGISPGMAAALIDSAGPLGMLATSPPRLHSYDLSIVLGGTVTGNELRVALAASFDRAGVTLGQVVPLAAHRPLTAAELATGEVRPGETSEWQHLFRIACQTFSAAEGIPPWPDDVTSCSQMAIDKLVPTQAGQPGVRLMAAPTTDSRRRANTADAVGFLAERIPAALRCRVLVITSAIYVPYQFLIAAPLLLDAEPSHVEFVGTPTATGDNRTLVAQRIGQEIHAAVSAAARLWS